MGEHAVRRIQEAHERSRFMHHLLSDLDSLDHMLDRGLIDGRTMHIGAEQEFCIVDRNWGPSTEAQQVMDMVQDPHFTTELAKYNLEINLDPQALDGGHLRRMEEQLRLLMDKAEGAAKKRGLNIVLTGILPTLTARHIEMDHMTPSPRYFALDEAMRSQKGGAFELHISGVDELIAKHPSIVFEACNTSFQMHLQLKPEDAVDQYNWAQMIAAPVLAACANSPLLLGKELWAETRIALFQQSIDVRNSDTLIREQHPRVTFGTRWLRERVTEVIKEDIVRYEMLLTTDLDDRSSGDELREGKVPKLRALALHNGTVYRWNRLCYGASKDVAHIRIECRYVPSGPTLLDEMANMALWTGLMCGMRDEHRRLWEKMPFRQAKANFVRAALSGMETKLNWMGTFRDTRDLLLHELLPLAEEGLRSIGTDPGDIQRYLDVIRQRLGSHNGAHWLTNAARALRSDHRKDIALRRATALMHRNAATGAPVGEWAAADAAQLTGDELELEKVYQLMSTDIFTVRPDDLVELVRRIMAWRNVHHVPVESGGRLVGLVTLHDLGPATTGAMDLRSVSEVMRRDLVTASPNDDLQRSAERMKAHGFGCLPVVHDDALVGVLTRVDLKRMGV